MAQNRTQRASVAHTAAMAHVARLTETTKALREAPPLSRKIDAAMRGILPGWSPQERQQLSQAEMVRLGDLIGDCAVSELWKQNGRVIYDLHEELADALYRSKMTAVPGALFERIPHINPMIVLPDPWPAGKGRGGFSEGYVRAIYITGYSGASVCNSNDPDRDGIALMFCYDVLDEETGEMIPGYNRDLIPLPTGRDKFTARDVIEFAEKWQGGNMTDPGFESAVKTFRPIIQKAFAVLTYLCTDNRDLPDEPVAPPQTRRKTGNGRKEPDPFWVRVGWYVGPQLHSSRLRARGAEKPGVSIPTGVEYGPQHRAGHFKTVWIGPGKSGQRTQSTTTWVEPYWTGLEDLPEGQDPPTQVVPVDPQRGDPFRRRDTVGK
jgi:hypothetical protein